VSLADIKAVMLLLAESQATGVSLADMFPIQTLEAVSTSDGVTWADVDRIGDLIALSTATGLSTAELVPLLPALSEAIGESSVDFGISVTSTSSGTSLADITKQGLLTALSVSEGVSSAMVSGVSYTDPFTAANQAGLNRTGYPWLHANGTQPSISSNVAALTTATAGTYMALFNAPVSTDDMRVGFTTASALTAAGNYMIVRSPSNFGLHVVAVIWNGGVTIGTETSGTGTGFVTRAQRGSAPTTTASGVAWKFEAVGNVYTVYANGTAQVSWTDNTNVITPGPSNRSGGIGIARSGSTNGASADNFVVEDIPAPVLVASDNFDTALGSNWISKGGGQLYVNGQGYVSGVGTPSEPMSYIFWKNPVPGDSQIVEATVRWNGNDPGHSAAAVVLRANPANMPSAGASGVQFWFVNNLMGILYEDPNAPNGFVPATGTSDYVSTTKFPEGARIRLRADGNTYTAYMNGAIVLQGTVPTSVVPTSNRYVGIMIQDDSGVSGGGQPPACLDNWAAYVF